MLKHEPILAEDCQKLQVHRFTYHIIVDTRQPAALRASAVKALF
jgi:hypothetical protein